MNLSIDCPYISAEASDSVLQMKELFQTFLLQLTENAPNFVNIERLSICVTVQHPILGNYQHLGRSYSKGNRTYYVEGQVDYAGLASKDWAIRTDAFAETVKDCLSRVAKSRVTEAERAYLQAQVERARLHIRCSPPEEVKPVAPIFLIHDASAKDPIVSFSPVTKPISGSARVTEVPPEDAMSLAKTPELRKQRESSPIFKLYKRMDGRLHYHEGWARENEVVEHWGKCGEKGEVRHHPVSSPSEARKLLASLRSQVRSSDYRSIPMSRHQTAVIEYAIDGFGDESDLQFRHAAEKHLNNLIGWLGLGHCDGGSTGSDSMEVFCRVVDFNVAKAALEGELPGSKFGRFTRIYNLV